MSGPYWADGTVTLHLGDCLAVLAGMAPASVDAVVTDPPYSLSFMGSIWDTFTPAAFQAWCQAWAAECLRVLKPGGHLLAFGGTRTWHRLACGIEDAGFEIRDSVADLTGREGPGLAWLYGSGFPKSLDVSKAIDKRAEENIETKRRIAAVAEVIRSHREARGMTPQQVSMAVVGSPSGACWNWEHQQLPSAGMWPAIKATLGIPGKYDALIEGDRARFIAAEREVIAERTVPIGHAFAGGTYGGDSSSRRVDVTAPATEDAARWEGWGTALKPAWEPIVVARKPLAGTVAANVTEHGTGALNVDGCRVAHVSDADRAESEGKNRHADFGSGPRDNHVFGTDFRDRWGQGNYDGSAGRWPPNVMLGPDAAAELDRQSGNVPSAGMYAKGSRGIGPKAGAASIPIDGLTSATYADSGGASRFFPVFRYEAKAPASERPRGEDGTAHPTVKPVDLMAWLVRLVTPPGGLVLDPFAGSGTTAEACIVEGFRCVLIEKDPAYAALIRKRLRKDIQPAMFGS